MRDPEGLAFRADAFGVPDFWEWFRDAVDDMIDIARHFQYL
jgi:hypothetical protein